jgi:F-type H+-transporting ATPase subunit a
LPASFLAAFIASIKVTKLFKIQTIFQMSHIIESETAHEVVANTPHSTGHSPLAQFEVKKIFDLKIGNIDISFTNSSLYMMIATFFVIGFMLLATRKRSLVPSKFQVFAESIYGFVFDMLKSSVGDEGIKFFPLIFSLFTFILLGNILGMTPYSFTSTSQIAVTITLAMIAFLTVVGFAIARNGVGGFFHMFLPSGVPIWMAPIIFLIEFFSFLIRPVTLSVRLFANMVAGHVLLKVVAGFIISLGIIFGALPFLFSIIMTGFELFVAILQAYIFSILVCAYLGDVTKEH